MHLPRSRIALSLVIVLLVFFAGCFGGAPEEKKKTSDGGGGGQPPTRDLIAEQTTLFLFLNQSGIPDAVVEVTESRVLVRYNVPAGWSEDAALNYALVGALSLIPNATQIVIQPYSDFRPLQELALTREGAARMIRGDAAPADGWQQFSASYFFSAETSYKKIEINATTMTIVYFADAETKCPGWVAQSPCWTQNDLTTRQANLSNSDLNLLVNAIDDAKFANLSGSYGNASSGQRYYEHAVSVTIQNQTKRVVYQDFPEAVPMPDAFKQVKDALLLLANEKFGV